MINPLRLRQVRELCRMTQSDLAADVGVTQPMIAQIEGGRVQPSPELMRAIADRLGFPVAYFEMGDPPAFPLGSLLFRGHSDLTAMDKAEAYHYGEIAYEAFSTLSKRVRSKITLRLPQLEEDTWTPAEAAQLTRNALGLTLETPISQLMRLIEESGVIAFRIPVTLEGRDAYSLWTGATSLWSSSDIRRPVMVLFDGASGDRARFSIAHELGHLVLHQSLHGTSMEHEANLFAQELLLPEAAMRREMTGGITLATLAIMKQHWGVSMAALAMRASELNIISKRQLSYLMAKLNTHGWRTQEPVEIIMEKPRGLRKMIEVLYGEQIDYHRLGNDLRMPPHFVKRLVESHATKAEFNVATVSGGSKRERGKTLTFGRAPTAPKEGVKEGADEVDITSARPS